LKPWTLPEDHPPDHPSLTRVDVDQDAAGLTLLLAELLTRPNTTIQIYKYTDIQGEMEKWRDGEMERWRDAEMER